MFDEVILAQLVVFSRVCFCKIHELSLVNDTLNYAKKRSGQYFLPIFFT